MTETPEKRIEELEWEIHCLHEKIEAMQKQYEYAVRRPRQLRRVLEQTPNGHYLVTQIIEVQSTPDGENIILRAEGGK